MANSQDARHIVLKVKELMVEMGKTSMERDRFVDLCTSISKDFLQRRRGSFTVPLQSFDIQLLQKMIAEATGEVSAFRASSPGVTHRGGPTTRSALSSRSPSANGGTLPQTMVLPPIKVAVATTIKNILDPYYRATLLTREAFSLFVQEVTKQFFSKFPLDKISHPQLRDSDLVWLSSTIEAKLRQDHGIDPDAVKAPPAVVTREPPVDEVTAAPLASNGAATDVQHSSTSEQQPRSRSAFDSQMEKLKEVINKEFADEQEVATRFQQQQDMTPSRAAMKEGVEVAKRRKQLIEELRKLDEEAARIQQERTKRLEMLAALL